MTERIKPALEDLLLVFRHMPDAERLQAKYEAMVAIMEGEGANAAAGIWITCMADFAIALMNHGQDPRTVLLNCRRDAQKMVDDKLKQQNIVLNMTGAMKPN